MQGTCKVTACKGKNQKGQILGNKHAEEAACMDKYAREEALGITSMHHIQTCKEHVSKRTSVPKYSGYSYA
jgi:hypothetical protein